jgi:hypothetical protein
MQANKAAAGEECLKKQEVFISSDLIEFWYHALANPWYVRLNPMVRH